MRRALAGSVAGVGLTVAFAAALVPLRSHLSIATVGLLLVVPVVIGVVAGGVRAGVVSVVFGFLTFDWVFIPPYGTLSVGAGQNWVALGVYAVVMLVVARVVSRLQDAREEAQRRATAAQRLLEVSQLLVTEHDRGAILQSAADSARQIFAVGGVALLLPAGDSLAVVATSGEPPAAEQLAALRSDGSAVPVPVGVELRRSGIMHAVPLVSSGRPVGVLALRGTPPAAADPDLVQTFVNQVALAVERSELRDQALRSQVIEESDRLRRALLGAVSHDLRTPLATLKVASSSLIASESQLDPESRRQLYELLDSQADRLGRLVSGLLDMNRYQSGALELKMEPCPVADLVADALDSLTPALGDRPFNVSVPDGIPLVNADRVLIGQVIVNLIDNADRHAPPGTAISLDATTSGRQVVLSLADEGPGVPAAEHDAVFESFFRTDSGGRAGLGLWICRTFVEAHQQRIWVEDAHPGARFSFTLDAVS